MNQDIIIFLIDSFLFNRGEKFCKQQWDKVDIIPNESYIWNKYPFIHARVIIFHVTKGSGSHIFTDKKF